MLKEAVFHKLLPEILKIGLLRVFQIVCELKWTEIGLQWIISGCYFIIAGCYDVVAGSYLNRSNVFFLIK